MDFGHRSGFRHIQSPRAHIDVFDVAKLSVARFQIIASADLDILRGKVVSIDGTALRASDAFDELQTGYGKSFAEGDTQGLLAEMRRSCVKRGASGWTNTTQKANLTLDLIEFLDSKFRF